MDFLKALEQAKQMGVSEEEYVKIWDQEMKLKQQQEEAKTLELKLACEKIQAQETAHAQSIKDQTKSMLQNHLKEMRNLFSELKSEQHQQNQIQLQELNTQLGNQASMMAVMTRNEVLGVLSQFGIGHGANYYQNFPNAYGDSQHASAGHAGGLPNGTPKHCKLSNELDSVEDVESVFPVDVGAVFYVQDVENLANNTSVTTSSPFYILTDCPSKAGLTVWFGKNGNIQVQVSICGTMNKSLKQARIFTITGHVLNKNSGSYSPLFEGTSPPLRRLRPNKEMVVKTVVCLKTGSGSYENVTLDELEKRNFVVNNIVVIKWFVTSEEVQQEDDDDAA